MSVRFQACRDPRARQAATVLCAVLIALALHGCGGTARQQAGKPWHHLDDGTFRNPEGSFARRARFGDMLAFFSRRMRDQPVQVPRDHALPPAEALAALNGAGANSITWLGHAAFLLRIDGKTILTDPYLTARAGPLGFGPERYVAAGIPLERLPPIDFILVSHNHYDHLDAETIDMLPDKLRARVIVPLGLGEFFRSRGYARVHELDWYERISSDGIEIAVLPAVHFSRRGPFDKNRSLWSGFAIRGAHASIFHSGDTGYHDTVFREIGRRAGPFDLALVAIGAYEPRSIMRAVHVNPEEAVQLIADIGAKKALGMHWGTVQLTDEPAFEPPRRFIEAARAAGWRDGRAGVMRIGETRPLPFD